MQTLIYALISVSVLFLSYRVTFKNSLIISILASIFLIIFYLKPLSYQAIVGILYLNSLPLITEQFRRNFSAHKQTMRERFEKINASYEQLARRDKLEIESNLEREKRLNQILSLYETSKQMSAFISFEHIFNIFSSALRKSFRFRTARIVLLKDIPDKETVEIDAVYCVELGRKNTRLTPDRFDSELAEIALKTRKMICVTLQEESMLLKSLSIIKEFETLISIPLFVEEKISGVLYIENIPRAYFDNFTILAAQFAIQFQKVILYRRLQEMAITDTLTEVSTRRYFLERFREEVRRSMRHKSSLSFLMLDLDHFKKTNDKFGHLVGDVVLKEVAHILKSNLREIDIIGRYGGEEFSIVLTGIDRNGAFQVAERIRENIAGSVFKAYDETVVTTVSIGVSVFPEDGVDPDALIESADKALYKAKETGRNKVC